MTVDMLAEYAHVHAHAHRSYVCSYGNHPLVLETISHGLANGSRVVNSSIFSALECLVKWQPYWYCKYYITDIYIYMGFAFKLLMNFEYE